MTHDLFPYRSNMGPRRETIAARKRKVNERREIFAEYLSLDVPITQIAHLMDIPLQRAWRYFKEICDRRGPQCKGAWIVEGQWDERGRPVGTQMASGSDGTASPNVVARTNAHDSTL